MPQVAGAVASWGSFGSSSLLPAPKSYFPSSFRSIPCWTTCKSLRWSATSRETVIVREYVSLPSLSATGIRSTARPLSFDVSPLVVKEMLMSPYCGSPSAVVTMPSPSLSALLSGQRKSWPSVEPWMCWAWG
ncbi:hypothetical protein SCALM49S_09172 [Streptomyces californicus]